MSLHPDDAKAADAFLDEVREYVDAQQWVPAIPVLALKFRALEAENADLRARIAKAREILKTARKEVLKRRRNAQSYIEIAFAVVEMRLGENVVDDSAERGALDALKELGE